MQRHCVVTHCNACSEPDPCVRGGWPAAGPCGIYLHSAVPLTLYKLSHTSMHRVSKVNATSAISSCYLLASY